MPFMKGVAPVRRTLNFLTKEPFVFRKSVEVMAVNYAINQKSSAGTYEFAFWHLPQLQYKNPTVQIVKFKNMTPTPFIKFYFTDGHELLVDCYGKTRAEIVEHIKNTLCKTWEEQHQADVLLDPSLFGPNYARRCICEVPGQVPCPGRVPLPKELRGIRKPKTGNEDEEEDF